MKIYIFLILIIFLVGCTSEDILIDQNMQTNETEDIMLNNQNKNHPL